MMLNQVSVIVMEPNIPAFREALAFTNHLIQKLSITPGKITIEEQERTMAKDEKAHLFIVTFPDQYSLFAFGVQYGGRIPKT